MQELKPNLDDVLECWSLGVQPLVDAYGRSVIPLLQAIVYSHRANFPVPIFITGSARARAGALLEAVNDLTGDWSVIHRRTTTLPTLRLAAERRQPLLVDDAAPGAGHEGPSMFELISDETLDYGSPLQEVSLLVASGGRRLSKQLRDRSLPVVLTSPGPSVSALRAVTSAAASDARRLVQIHLQQSADRAITPRARRHVHTAADTALPPAQRRDAALEVAVTLLRSMELPALEAPEDPVVAATRAALLSSLDEPAVAGRLAQDLYAVPAQLVPRVRAAAGNDELTHSDIVRALESSHLLTTHAKNSATPGSTTPTRTPNGLQRVWRISRDLIR